MIIENMRDFLRDEAGFAIIRAYLIAIEKGDVAAMKRMVHPDVELIHANYPPVYGRHEAVAMIMGYLDIVDSVEFDLKSIFGADNTYVVEKVNVAVRPQGTVNVRTTTFLSVDEDGLLDSVRIYADTSALFRQAGSEMAPVST